MSKYLLILLDRDGVINQSPIEGDYVLHEQELVLFGNVITAIAHVSKIKNVACVTNQQCVGKGLLSSSELEIIHSKIANKVLSAGGNRIHFYVCPHTINDRCNCRKPKPGLILQSMSDFKVNREEICFIGDRDTDRMAAEAAGIDFFLTSSDFETVEILSEFKCGEHAIK